jgi:hypothetical protein
MQIKSANLLIISRSTETAEKKEMHLRGLPVFKERWTLEELAKQLNCSK